jgi:DNA-binding HxlR family transcriptional regulator
VVGERWTILIIREQLLRPRRYHELLDGLPGIGTKLLAERLRFLTVMGLVEPIDPRRRTAGYTVMEPGRTLHEPILGLAQFGLRVGAGRPRPPNATSRPAWAALAIETMIDTGQAPDIDEIYQFDVDDEVFHVVAADGGAVVRVGPSDAPDMIATTDAQTFFDMGMRRLGPIEALVSGAIRVTGISAAVPRCLRLIGLGAADIPPTSSVRTNSQR